MRRQHRRVGVELLEGRCLLSGAPEFDILSINPANGTVVSALQNGQIIVTLSEPVAGLTDGQSPIQNSGTFNAYDVTLIPRGPSGVFSAPSGVDGGDLPVHVNVIYHVNNDGTSEFVITPTGPLSTDVYAVHVDLSAFKDGSGNTLVDGNNGYRTFLLQLPPVNPSAPLAVTGVTGFSDISPNGYAINSNMVNTPNTIQIAFNKPLFAGAAGNGNVQLVSNPGPNFRVVPSVAAYSPTNDSIYLTPTASLSFGTVYAIRVAGQDSGSTYVSDDQGFGGPGHPLPQTFYDTFEVNGPVRDPISFTTPSITPANGTLLTTAPGLVTIGFGAPLNPQSLGRYSQMVIPRSGGLDTFQFDAGDAPLNATVAYNPNTWKLVIVPSQRVANDVYLVAVGPMSGTSGQPLLNNANQPAGVSGNPPFYSTFEVNTLTPSAAMPDVLVTITDPTTPDRQAVGRDRSRRER